MDFSRIIITIVLAIWLARLINFICVKNKIKKIGKIKCNRCGHQGEARPGGFLRDKITCPNCESGEWRKANL